MPNARLLHISMLVLSLTGCRMLYATPSDGYGATPSPLDEPEWLQGEEPEWLEGEVRRDYDAEELSAFENGEFDVDDPFAFWDADADGTLTRAEFDVAIANLYDGWDQNGDGLLSEAELQAGVWGTWDADGDDIVFQDQWTAPWFDDTHGSFATWDRNANDVLTRLEFGQVWEQDDLDALWDADGDARITRREFGDQLWATWNLDDDVYITRNEMGW